MEGREAGYCADGWYPALQLRKTTVKMQHLKQDCCYCSEAVSGHDVKQLFLFGMGRPVKSGVLAESRCVPGTRSLRKTYLVDENQSSEEPGYPAEIREPLVGTCAVKHEVSLSSGAQMEHCSIIWKEFFPLRTFRSLVLLP